MWQEDELEPSAAAGIRAGLCADVITILPLRREVELKEGTHHVFSAQEKPFYFFYDLHNLFEFAF